jgi:hypothetical protein
VNYQPGDLVRTTWGRARVVNRRLGGLRDQQEYYDVEMFAEGQIREVAIPGEDVFGLVSAVDRLADLVDP